MRGLGILAAGAVVLVWAASGLAEAVVVPVANPPTLSDFKLEPKKLPRRTLAPAALSFSAKLPTTSLTGGPAPAAKEIVLLLDRNVVLDFDGYPVCRGEAKLQPQPLPEPPLSEECRKAIVGGGSASFEIRFPGSESVTESSRLLLINGGRSGGAWTLFARAEITVPVPATIVTTVKIKPIQKGRYGTEATFTLPKVAGGSGLLTQMRFKLDKRFRRDGRKVGIVNAKCPDGKLQLLARFQFADGTRAEEEMIKPCTPRDG
jgi:hypothetical protein